MAIKEEDKDALIIAAIILLSAAVRKAPAPAPPPEEPTPTPPPEEEPEVPPTPTGSLAISPTEITADATFKATWSGFTAGHQIYLKAMPTGMPYWGLGTTSSGSKTAAAPAEGTYTLKAVQPYTSIESNTVTLTVKPAVAPPPIVIPLSVKTDKGSYAPGELVVISGSGPAGQNAALQVVRPDGVTLYLDVVKIATDGSYSSSFRLPLTTMKGTYKVYATVPGGLDSTSFEVL